MTTARPILFSAPMIRAQLADTKTQTRRIVKQQDRLRMGHDVVQKGDMRPEYLNEYGSWQAWVPNAKTMRCPYGSPGDLLWVRESVTRFDRGTCDEHIWYRAGSNGDSCSPQTIALAGGADCEWPKGVEGPGGGAAYHVPSIHMPKWASRLTLELTDVRVERLQDISEADAIAEGVDSVSMADVRRQATRSRRSDYAQLWNHINGAGAWEQNPWVWALTFRVHKINIEEFLSAKTSEAA